MTDSAWGRGFFVNDGDRAGEPVSDELLARAWEVLGPSDFAPEPAAFDRWLASVKADAWDAGYNAGWEGATVHADIANPYR